MPNRPARVTSFKQFTDQFGGLFAGSYGAYMVKGFFDNGGQTAYINRVVSTASDPQSGAVPASHTFNDGAAKGTLKVTAGQRGTADPGAWGNFVRVEVDYDVALDPGSTQSFDELFNLTISEISTLPANMV